jgi:hypothetical protein
LQLQLLTIALVGNQLQLQLLQIWSTTATQLDLQRLVIRTTPVFTCMVCELELMMAEESSAASLVMRTVEGLERDSSLATRGRIAVKSAGWSKPAPLIQAAVNSELARGSEAKDAEGRKDLGSNAMAHRTAVEIVERVRWCPIVTLQIGCY